VVERLMLSASEEVVDLATVRLALPGAESSPATFSGSGPLAERVETFEREVILAELKRHQNNVTSAARSLGLERSHLYKKAEQLGINLRVLRQERGTADHS